MSGSKGIAFILTIAISVLFVILVAAFVYSTIGRQKFAHQRSLKARAAYRAEAGRQDAIARLRLWDRSGGSPGGLDTTLAHDYCLDIDADPPDTLCGAPPGCADPCDVRVEIIPRDANGLNKITTTATY